MSEDKLQAAIQSAKDEAAREFTQPSVGNFEMLKCLHDFSEEHKNEAFWHLAMQLYAAQCVKDERERIRLGLPQDYHAMGGMIETENHDKIIGFRAGAKWYREQVSQLIERGDG